MTVITLENVTKIFGRNIAMESISYSVEPGTVFALLGENGAGKTTTIRVLLGMCDPDDGRSTVLGLDSRKDDLAIRRRVGYVPEQPSLYDWMTVAEIGQFAAAFYAAGFWPEYTRLVAGFQLPLETKIKNLSKGMRAKVSLSLALANDPELLILDEPTSGLDPMVRREFLESMVDRAATGKTVFLSSHQISEVERVADYIAIMKKSKLRLVERLDVLKETTRLLTTTLSEPVKYLKDGIPAPEFFASTAPFGEIVQIKISDSGKDIRIIGRQPDPNIETILAANTNIGRFELTMPSLEEIFVAYMS